MPEPPAVSEMSSSGTAFQNRREAFLTAALLSVDGRVGGPWKSWKNASVGKAGGTGKLE